MVINENNGCVPMVESDSDNTGSKVTSLIKMEANRENAQQSTGPRSDEGKAISSQNSIKHGIFARRLLPWEDPEDFMNFARRILRLLDVKNEFEYEIGVSLVHRFWMLRRIQSAYTNAFRLHRQGSMDDSELMACLERLQKYQKHGWGLIKNQMEIFHLIRPGFKLLDGFSEVLWQTTLKAKLEKEFRIES